MCGAAACACSAARLSHFSITTKVSGPKLPREAGIPAASTVASYSTQPASASTAGRLAAKASRICWRWPGLAVMTVLSLAFEQSQWRAPSRATWGSILFNAVLIFGFAHAAWFYLARGLPPVASTLSVMLIPVLGVFSGALWLGEALHWQDWTAVALMVVAIASVLWPARGR